jgi:oleandomycin transport system permease protein
MTAIPATVPAGPRAAGPAAPDRRISLMTGIENTLTLTWRSLLRIRTSLEDLIGLSLQPIMFLVLFTYVFGGAISGSTHGYLQYALPGLLVQSVLFATLGTGLMLNSDISGGVFDRFRSLPIARWAPLAGAILGDIVRYMVSVAVMLGFGMILGFRILTNPLAAAAGCAVVLGFALAMCWISALIGLLARTAQGVQAFGFVLLFPIVFASNLLVPSRTMPGWLQAFVRVNPMSDLATATRGLMTGGPVASATLKSALWALGIVVVFAPLAVRVYRRKT